VQVKKDTQVQAELLGIFGVEMQDTHGPKLSGLVFRDKEKTKQIHQKISLRVYGLVLHLVV
jgi:hypothetical protein